MSAESHGKSPFASIWTSTIGLKVIMAVSGFLLAGFVLFHMLGNLQIFMGPEQMNAYAAFMQGLGGALWMARIGLLGLLVAHVWAAVQLIQRNMAARPNRYEGQRYQKTSIHARAMKYTGVIVLLYIIIHILHFTVGWIYPEYAALRDQLGRRDVYNYFVLSFQQPAVTILYVFANLMLASHLSHSLSAMFRTLGWSRGSFRQPISYIGPAFATIVAIGNVAMPLACLFGILQPTVQG